MLEGRRREPVVRANQYLLVGSILKADTRGSDTHVAEVGRRFDRLQKVDHERPLVRGIDKRRRDVRLVRDVELVVRAAEDRGRKDEGEVLERHERRRLAPDEPLEERDDKAEHEAVDPEGRQGVCQIPGCEGATAARVMNQTYKGKLRAKPQTAGALADTLPGEEDGSG